MRCIRCSSAFENRAGLLSHMEEHHHVCIFLCGTFVHDDKALRQHYVDKHFGCSHCSIRSLRDEREQEDHYNNAHHGVRGNNGHSHSDDALFRCRICADRRGFSELEELDSHVRTYHGVIDCPDFRCRDPTRVHWLPSQRAHMEKCHHPNPCNDFESTTTTGFKNCHICNFSCLSNSMLQHYQNCHPCKECEGYLEHYFKVKNDHISQCHGEERYGHQPFERSRWKTSTPRPKQKRPPPPPAPTDIYAILQIHPRCSDDEAKRAARQRRIDTHPDKLKKEDMSKIETDTNDEMAKLVGFAADIVSDPARRRKHDGEVWRWRAKYGRC